MDDWIRGLKCLSLWLDEWGYNEPENYHLIGRSEFRKRSHNAWAAEEIMREIKKYPGKDPIDTLERFRGRVDDLCCIAKTDRAKDLLITLYEVTTNALEYLVCWELDYMGYSRLL